MQEKPRKNEENIDYAVDEELQPYLAITQALTRSVNVLEHVELGWQIGEGSCAKVSKGTYKSESEPAVVVAVKLIPIDTGAISSGNTVVHIYS